jgi:hypothetical protein
MGWAENAMNANKKEAITQESYCTIRGYELLRRKSYGECARSIAPHKKLSCSVVASPVASPVASRLINKIVSIDCLRVFE